MKAKLIFDTSDPDEKRALQRAVNADRAYRLLSDLKDDFFRKYENTSEDEAEASWHTVRRDILEELNELEIDELWQ